MKTNIFVEFVLRSYSRFLLSTRQQCGCTGRTRI